LNIKLNPEVSSQGRQPATSRSRQPQPPAAFTPPVNSRLHTWNSRFSYSEFMYK